MIFYKMNKLDEKAVIKYKFAEKELSTKAIHDDMVVALMNKNAPSYATVNR